MVRISWQNNLNFFLLTIIYGSLENWSMLEYRINRYWLVSLHIKDYKLYFYEAHQWTCMAINCITCFSTVSPASYKFCSRISQSSTLLGSLLTNTAFRIFPTALTLTWVQSGSTIHYASLFATYKKNSKFESHENKGQSLFEGRI